MPLLWRRRAGAVWQRRAPGGHEAGRQDHPAPPGQQHVRARCHPPCQTVVSCLIPCCCSSPQYGVYFPPRAGSSTQGWRWARTSARRASSPTSCWWLRPRRCRTWCLKRTCSAARCFRPWMMLGAAPPRAALPCALLTCPRQEYPHAASRSHEPCCMADFRRTCPWRGTAHGMPAWLMGGVGLRRAISRAVAVAVMRQAAEQGHLHSSVAQGALQKGGEKGLESWVDLQVGAPTSAVDPSVGHARHWRRREQHP